MILRETPTIFIQKVSHSYIGKNSNQLSISNFDLKVFSGEFVTIIGPSGSGKTTILNLIAGLLSPTYGDISIVGLSPKNTQSRKYIGMVFQTPPILPWLNVSQNLLLPLEINPCNPRDFENESIVSNMLSIIQMEDYIMS